LGSARVFVDYDHHPSDADVEELERLGVEVTFRPKYLDTVSATAPFETILSPYGIRSLPGVVMVEDLGLAEPHMNEAVPNMGVDQVWNDFGFDGTGSVVAVLDTGVRGDHEGLNDMDDEPFTTGCEQPDPDPLNPNPIFVDCDPKIIAFYDAVLMDDEQDPSTSYDSGTHGSHVAGIAVGTGGGQTDPTTGQKYVGAAPGAFLINILACCDGDIEDVIQGAQWAIDNKEKYGIDIVTSSLGEQQLEVHFDNNGDSAWSRQMDAVVEAGIITTLSAGNEFGGATFAGCNTIDSPGDAQLPVTVASLDKDLGLAIYSSRGYTSDGRVKPDVATIGSNIMAPDAASSDGYTSKSGTSMATPLMAGIAALMVEANPDLTPTEFKDIISAHSIERDLQLLDDPGFNDCSILETRPDNEFGYGQADPLAFVEAAGSIDRSLNVSMNLETLQEIGNQSYVSGTASGVAPGMGIVEVRVGGGEWKGAADLMGDWSEWRVKLDPHVESGNSTIYARLVISEDSISPVDARRIILVDDDASDIMSGDSLKFGISVFLFPFLCAVALIAFISFRERWDRKIDFSERSEGLSSRYSRVMKLLRGVDPRLYPGYAKSARNSWQDGKSLTENQFRRYVSLSILYTAQGLPQGFTYVAFPAFLAVNDVSPVAIAQLWAAIALPWTFKFVWGPMVDGIQAPSYGRRRPWILFAQTGMVVTLGALLFVSNLAESIQLVTLMLFIHNLFSSLQDVGVDALAVDVLQPDEVAKANGFMFAAKRAGYILGGAILGIMATMFGIKSAIIIQLPLLVIIMALPLFLRENPGDKLFPWGNSRKASLWDANEQDSEENEDDESSELEIPWPENEEDDQYRAAHWTAKNLISKDIALSAAVLWVSIALILLGMAVYIGGVLIEEDWRDRPILFMDIVDFGAVCISLVILLQLSQKLGIRIPKVPNPFADALRGPAITSYNIVKGFSLRSSFLLIFLCLLSELYLFVDPIILDIFINEAGWEMDKYSAVMGGVVIAFLMAGQLIGGFLGDRFGVREVAMIGFVLLALANAGLALLQGYWENTTIMVAYLCLRAIINGLAWISIISVSMRLTYSKAGGTQFTAYMSMFNLSGVIALSLTGKAIEIMDYISALYLGAALTLMTVIFLVFIDPDECDRVLEGRLDDDEDGNYGGDLGETPETWWEEGEPDVVSA
jgi:MFS family permease